MTDEPVRTEVRTDDGWLEFQEYFVHRHQEPEVHEVRFAGIEAARPTPEVLAALAAADVDRHRAVEPDRVDRADPGRARHARGAGRGARARACRSSRSAAIIGGKALKGPADRMLASLGHESSALGVARLYAEPGDGLRPRRDGRRPRAAAIAALGLRPVVTDTIMADDAGAARRRGRGPAGRRERRAS